MSQQPKKSVLIDLSDSKSSNKKNSKPPILWIFVLLILVACGLIFTIVPRTIEDRSPSAEAYSETSPISATEVPDLETIKEVKTEEAHEIQVTAPSPEPIIVEQSRMSSPKTSRIEVSTDIRPTQAAVKVMSKAPVEPAPEARDTLSKIQKISQYFQDILSLRFSDNTANALAFQLETALNSKADQATIHALENEYSNALAEQTIDALRSYLKQQTEQFAAKELGNYATLEWKAFGLKLAQAEQIDVKKKAFESLLAYEGAYNAGNQFLQSAAFNIQSLAKRSADSKQMESANKLYRELLFIKTSDTAAIEFLNKHAYPAGGHTHMAPAGIQMQFIPGSEYVIGTPELEFQRDADETLHTVTLTKAYYIATSEITQKQWVDVMGSLPAQFPNDAETTGEQLPIHSVSWAEAVEFCDALSTLSESMTYRLPTEAEWEIACRASLETPYNNGSDRLSLQQANIFDPNSSENLDKPTNVSSYPSNSWGLYDMHGNVWEWTSDWMADYSKLNNTDPSNSDLKGNSDENLRTKVLRGGSFYDEASFARSGNRWNYAPSIATVYIGFRIACTATF